jgi:hypothetical protein
VVERRAVARHRPRGAADEARRGRRGAGEQLVARGAGGLPQRSLEQLADDAEGELPLELAGGGAQRPQALRRRELAGSVQEAGLPDPGRPEDEREAALPPARPPQQVVDEPQLGVALE